MNAVITGLGVLAPNGLDTEEYWKATLEGRSGLVSVEGVAPSPTPVSVAGRLPDYSPDDSTPARLRIQTDRWTQMGLLCTEEALGDADLDLSGLDPYECGVITASASGGNLFVQKEIQNLYAKGPATVTAYQSIAWFYAATTGQISIRHGLKGPCGVLVSEQAGGLDVLGEARRALRKGSKMIVSGGLEAPIGPYALTCQSSDPRLSAVSDPHRAYLPFDRAASGHIPGEGGAILIIEDADSARERAAPRVYGEIAGGAATFDPRPDSGRPPGLARAVRVALEAADLSPDMVDVVFADGAGTVEGDRQEAEALVEVFGPRGVPITCPKTMVGRLYAGGASLDAATALLALRDQVVPPTIGVTDPIHDGLDLVLGAPREARLRTALILARGIGGFNSAVVLRREG